MKQPHRVMIGMRATTTVSGCALHTAAESHGTTVSPPPAPAGGSPAGWSHASPPNCHRPPAQPLPLARPGAALGRCLFVLRALRETSAPSALRLLPLPVFLGVLCALRVRSGLAFPLLSRSLCSKLLKTPFHRLTIDSCQAPSHPQNHPNPLIRKDLINIKKLSYNSDPIRYK